jgi:DNA mismatch repair protein PMS2
MQVIGQFNLGFILARCKNSHLWILDQHACDEKYNFEQLCEKTVLHEQKLLKPMLLDLSPSEEACILDHMNIFEANGFRFDFKPERPVRQRLFLTALPHSGAQNGRKSVQFGKDDVSALCAILSDGSSYDAGGGGTGTDGSGKYGNNAVRRYASTASSQQDTADRIVARLPKAIAMFASRACRTSIMIGTALSQKEMVKVVQRLADVEHPWNCPHGRPTMRHVGDVLPIFLNDERKAAEHITGPTVTVTPMTQEPSAEG